MFEHFDDRARRVVVLALEEARTLNHDGIGTENLLLGLIQESQGVAAKALQSLGIAYADARIGVARITGCGTPTPSGHVPFTPRAKKVLELSRREALKLGFNNVGTEAILLGVISDGKGVGARVLLSLGVDLARVRQEMIKLLVAR